MSDRREFADVRDGEEIVQARLTGSAAEGLRTTEVVFEGVTFDGVVARGHVFSDCRFYNCEIVGGDWSLVRLDGCSFDDARFRSTRLDAVDWTLVDAGLSGLGVRFHECRLALGTFSGLTLRGLEIDDCDLAEVDLTGCDLREAVITGGRAPAARLDGADVRGASILGVADLHLDPRASRVEGLRLDPGSALNVVAALGIEIPTPDA